jgi:hypothetical protein
MNKVLSRKVLAKLITSPAAVTTFAAFVSTGVTLAYSCVRLRNLSLHQQISQTAWLFEGNHGRLRKDFGQF